VPLPRRAPTRPWRSPCRYLIFKVIGLEPTGARHAKVTDAGISWNYTIVLNIVFRVARHRTRLALLPARAAASRCFA
jgi:hypothetical protein